MWTIAARRSIDARRRSGRHAVPVGVEPGATGSADSAEDVVLAGALDAPLAAAINRQSLELRAVLQATVLDELTVTETAER